MHHEKALTRRNNELALLNQAGSTLSSSLELDEILNKTLALIMAHFGVEVGEIFLTDENGETLSLVLHRGEDAEAFWTRNRFKMGEGMIGKAASTRKPITSHHLEKDEGMTRRAVVEAGFKQITCIPILSRGGVIGVLSIATRNKKTILDDELQLLVSVAALAGISIENATLHFNAQRLAILEERERIGMDLHDGIIQSIYGVGLVLESAKNLIKEDPQASRERLTKAMQDLDRTIRDIRSYILDLRPRQLYGTTLFEGLNHLISEFRQNTNIEVEIKTPKNNLLGDLTQGNAMALFHICQEALANVAKHSNSHKVMVELWATEDRVLLEIHDDGRGFDVENTNKTVGHGLANMQTRIAKVGGDIDFSSSPGEGTTILAWVHRVHHNPSN